MRCSSGATRRLAIPGVALAVIFAAATTTAPAQPSKLEIHRLAVRAHAVEEVHLAGRVTQVVGINQIVTSWTPAQLLDNRLEDLDTVLMQVGAVTFRARLMNIDTYVARSEADSEGAIDTDAGAVMLLDDARGEVTLVGYAGALATWTEAAPGTKVSLSATWFKGDR